MLLYITALPRLNLSEFASSGRVVSFFETSSKRSYALFEISNLYLNFGTSFLVSQDHVRS
jgi:hypothetical protein